MRHDILLELLTNGDFRITLTSRKCGSLEKVCQELIERAKSKDLRVKGPVRLPVRRSHVLTSGAASISWDIELATKGGSASNYWPISPFKPIPMKPGLRMPIADHSLDIDQVPQSYD